LLERIPQGHVGRLAASDASDREIVDELFLLSLSRWPDEDERKAALEYVARTENRVSGFRDILWSLLNTREFVTHH
jgi:hypothetical protein